MKMKVEKNDGQLKIFFDERKKFIRRVRKTGVMDIKRLQVTDSSYIECTICLVNESIGAKEMVFRAWEHKWVPLNSQWLVLRISGTDFFHCWVANSIWLGRAESLITKR